MQDQQTNLTPNSTQPKPRISILALISFIFGFITIALYYLGVWAMDPVIARNLGFYSLYNNFSGFTFTLCILFGVAALIVALKNPSRYRPINKIFFIPAILIVITILPIVLGFGALGIMDKINTASAPHQYQGEIVELKPGWLIRVRTDRGTEQIVYMTNSAQVICLPENGCYPEPDTIIKRCSNEEGNKKCVIGNFNDLSIGQKVIANGNPGAMGTFGATDIEIIQ